MMHHVEAFYPPEIDALRRDSGALDVFERAFAPPHVTDVPVET